MQKPKILSIVTDLIRGGSEGQCARTVLGLTARGQQHKVAVFYRQGYFLDQVEQATGPVYEVHIRKAASFQTLNEIHKLARYIKTNDFTAVHTWDAEAAIFGGLAAKWAGVPLITSRRDLGEIYPRWKQVVLHRADKQARAIVVNALAIAHHFGWSLDTEDRAGSSDLPYSSQPEPSTGAGTPSSRTDPASTLNSPGLDLGGTGASRLQKSKHVHHIPNIFDLADFDQQAENPLTQPLSEELTASTAPFRFIMVARMDPEKNIDLAIDALAQTNDNSILLLVGDGQERQALESRSKALGVSSRIHFLGERHDVPALLKQADAALLTPSHNEGLSNSILEYMAASLPTIATDCGGNAELIDDTTGAIIPIGDTQALTTAMNDLASHPNQAKTQGRAARKKLQTQYNPETILNKFEHLYKETAHESH